jgi:hypothetical protein
MSAQGNQGDPFRKMAGIHSLGLIQEVLVPSDLPESDINMIWDTMLNNIETAKADMELARIVARSIVRLAPATERIFQNEAEQDRIVRGIFDLLAIDDHEVQKDTLDCLIDVIRLNYRRMARYLPELKSWTVDYIAARGEGHELAAYAIEIWNTVFEEELNLAAAEAGVLKAFDWPGLAAIFLNGLQHTGFAEGDHSVENDDDNSLALMCTTALSLLSQIVKDELLDITFSYVQQLLGHTGQGNGNWLAAYAALCALNSSIEGCSPHRLEQTFGQVMSWVYERTEDDSLRVQICAAILLS